MVEQWGSVSLLQAPLLAYNHFVEALFTLNGCSEGLAASAAGPSAGSSPPSPHP